MALDGCDFHGYRTASPSLCPFVLFCFYWHLTCINSLRLVSELCQAVSSVPPFICSKPFLSAEQRGSGAPPGHCVPHSFLRSPLPQGQDERQSLLFGSSPLLSPVPVLPFRRTRPCLSILILVPGALVCSFLTLHLTLCHRHCQTEEATSNLNLVRRSVIKTMNQISRQNKHEWKAFNI